MTEAYYLQEIRRINHRHIVDGLDDLKSYILKETNICISEKVIREFYRAISSDIVTQNLDIRREMEKEKEKRTYPI